MNTVNWNLDINEYQFIEIIQIRFVPGTTDLSDSCEKLRLLVLSHQISQFGIPAFFLESSPEYVKEDFTSNPVVMVFDFEKRFHIFSLPSFFVATTFITDFETTFIDDIADHFQRALILKDYYKFYDKSPLYHSSYLLFSCSESWCDPFILQYIPSRIQNRLRFRVLVLDNLNIHVDSQNFIEERSIILISPFEHPFLVISSTPDQITVQYVDKTISTFQRNCINISHILKPSPSLLDIFQNLETIRSQFTPSSENFNQISNNNSKGFSLSEKEIDDFFREKIESKKKKEMKELEIKSSEFKDPPADIDIILTEQVFDPKLRMQISETLKPLCLCPSKKHDIKINITPYNTFFERNYGIVKFSIPRMSESIYTKTSAQFIKIEIPNVIVSQKGQLLERSAKEVINSWISESLRPISGPKSAHFIVFADSLLKENHMRQFFSHLTHVYSLLGFGELTLYSKTSAFNFSNPEDVMNNVSSFYEKNRILEFSTYPTLIFVIVNREFKKLIQNNILTLFITPHDVSISNFDYFKQLSFLIYSRIRIPSSDPYIAEVDSMDNSYSQNFIPRDIFFGFRYQPPFLLQRAKENILTLHVFWDPISTESVWTDDTGSTLHVVKMKNLLSIATAFDEIKATFIDIKIILNVGLLVQNISPRSIESIKHISNINIYTILPTPFVQVEYSTKTDEDGIIIAEHEQISNYSEISKKPLVCCYVVPKRFPTYFLSLYFTSNPNNVEVLKSIAINLSNLSWLSVKPGSEKRTIGYPPGLNLLLQKIPASSNNVNRFEFLPYIDQI